MSEENRKAELFATFRRGWRDGAACRAMNKAFTEHPTRQDLCDAYERAYEIGRDACTIAGAREADRLEYDPRMSMLRSEVKP